MPAINDRVPCTRKQEFCLNVENIGTARVVMVGAAERSRPFPTGVRCYCALRCGGAERDAVQR